MQHPFAFRRVWLAVAGAAACAAFGLTSTGAHASNLAACTFRAHVTRSGSTFSSDGTGEANCTGLVEGSLTAPDGAFATQGSYGGTTCSAGSWRGTFRAQLPRMLSLFDAQYAYLLGTMQLTQMGPALLVSGSGTADGQSISYAGTGSFTPDSGQACSGTLVENVALVDGGSAGSAQPDPPSHTARHRRHHHHHRHSRRHK